MQEISMSKNNKEQNIWKLNQVMIKQCKIKTNTRNAHVIVNMIDNKLYQLQETKVYTRRMEQCKWKSSSPNKKDDKK
jgi:hypothetical protein